MSEPKTVPLPTPPEPGGTTADGVIAGQLIPPIERIRLFSDLQWEEFVLEWADSLRQRYARVERCGSAGDMGRDVIARTDDREEGPWDNYQCKHYNAPLVPTEIWIELGKLAFYTKRGDYSYPRRYFFVAPQSAGTKLSNLLRKPETLRAGLFENWDRYCRSGITSTREVELDDSMRQYITTLDFSIFEAIPPLRIIDEHRKTRWHVYRFGGGLPPRPEPLLPPLDVAPAETGFVRELFAAYADRLKRPVAQTADLDHSEELREHFHDARLEFYSAESLRTFSRDTLPSGEFDRLQDEIHSGIRDDLRAEHADGYVRVLAVVKTARLLQLSGHALHARIVIRDRGGICHQLANDGKVRWVK